MQRTSTPTLLLNGDVIIDMRLSLRLRLPTVSARLLGDRGITSPSILSRNQPR